MSPVQIRPAGPAPIPPLLGPWSSWTRTLAFGRCWRKPEVEGSNPSGPAKERGKDFAAVYASLYLLLNCREKEFHRVIELALRGKGSITPQTSSFPLRRSLKQPNGKDCCHNYDIGDSCQSKEVDLCGHSRYRVLHKPPLFTSNYAQSSFSSG